MEEGEIRYSYYWPSKLWVGIALGIVAVFLATRGVEDAPWPVRILIWFVVLVIGMAALGASISTGIRINKAGELSLLTRILGMDWSTLRLEPGAVEKIELNADFVAFRRMGRTPSKSLRLRLEIRHKNGLNLVVADAVPTHSDETPPSHAGDVKNRMIEKHKQRLLLQAQLLALTLDCPLKFTGSGWGTDSDKESLVQLDPLELKTEAIRADQPQPIPLRKILLAVGGLLLVLALWSILGMGQVMRFIGITLIGAILVAPVLFAGYLLYRWWSFRLQTHARQRALQAQNSRQEQLDAIVRAAASEIAQASALSLNSYHAIPEARADELSVWFVFETEAAFAQALAAGEARRIDAMMRNALYRGRYPADALEDVFIGFKTHEALKRELGETYMALLGIQ